MFVGSGRGFAHRGERRAGRLGVALGPHAPGALDLPPLDRRVEAVELDPLARLTRRTR